MNYSWRCRICENVVEEGNDRCGVCNSEAILSEAKYLANKRYWEKYGKLPEDGGQNFRTKYDSHHKKSILIYFIAFFITYMTSSLIAFISSQDINVVTINLLILLGISTIFLTFVLPNFKKSECPECGEMQLICRVWPNPVVGGSTDFKCKSCNFVIQWRHTLDYEIKSK